MAKEICAITGGTSGLGEGFVERFAKDGYQVFFESKVQINYADILVFSLYCFRSSSVAEIKKQAKKLQQPTMLTLSRLM